MSLLFILLPAGTASAVGRPALAPAVVADEEDDDDDEDEDDDEEDAVSPALPIQHAITPQADTSVAPTTLATNAAPVNQETDENEDGPRWLERKLNLPEGIRVQGWLEAGGSMTAHHADHRLNFGINDSNPAQKVVLNQAYLIIEKPFKDGHDWDWGFRLDNLVGVDDSVFRPQGLLDSTFAWGQVGWLPVQMFGEMRMPLSADSSLEIKAGTFYALQGYEEGMAAYRPLYSTSYLYNFARPGTYTGIMTTWHLNDQIEIYNGIINAPDHWLLGGWHSNYAGGALVTSENEDSTAIVTFTAGPGNSRQYVFDAASARGAPPEQLAQTWLITEVLTHDFSDATSLALELMQGIAEGAPSATAHNAIAIAHWSGQGAWLSHDLSDDYTLILRGDRLHDPDGAHTGFRGDFYEATLGLRYEPLDWLILRPEIRYDFADAAHPYADGSRSSQHSAGLDAIIRF